LIFPAGACRFSFAYPDLNLLAYLFSRYPVVSQTFCDSEMLALEARGVPLAESIAQHDAAYGGAFKAAAQRAGFDLS